MGKTNEPGGLRGDETEKRKRKNRECKLALAQ